MNKSCFIHLWPQHCKINGKFSGPIYKPRFTKASFNKIKLDMKNVNKELNEGKLKCKRHKMYVLHKFNYFLKCSKILKTSKLSK